MKIFVKIFFQRWEYMHEPPKNSEEARLLKALQTPVDWMNLEQTK
jgi:hypothetical protein